MSTSLAYHTQGIVGFQHHSFHYSEGKVIQRLKRQEFRCPKCFHCSVNAHRYRIRRIQGLPYGSMALYFDVKNSDGFLRETGDFQFGSRKPVYQLGVCNGTSEPWHSDQHGRTGTMFG